MKSKAANASAARAHNAKVIGAGQYESVVHKPAPKTAGTGPKKTMTEEIQEEIQEQLKVRDSLAVAQSHWVQPYTSTKLIRQELKMRENIRKSFDEDMVEFRKETRQMLDEQMAELRDTLERDRQYRRCVDAFLYERTEILEAVRDEMEGTAEESDTLVDAYKEVRLIMMWLHAG
jgi:hypothetical protein